MIFSDTPGASPAVIFTPRLSNNSRAPNILHARTEARTHVLIVGIKDYRLDAHAFLYWNNGMVHVVSSCLSKSIVAGCRNNVCNRLILHSKGLEQICLVVTLPCSLHKFYTHKDCYVRCVLRTV